MINQKVGIIVQVRMGSTRLPGKILKNLNKNETVLDVLIKRLKLSKVANEIIIATTPDEKNALIVDVAKSYNLPYFIGSEENGLERYYQAAKNFNIEIVVKITSDCPFVDPKILDEMLIIYINNNYDYFKNVDGITPFPIGFDIEIFSFEILEKLYNLGKTEYEKEHITPIFYNHPERFSIVSYNNENLKYFEDLRLCLDYKEDLVVLREVYKKLKERGKSIVFTLEDILEIVDENPEIMDINKHYKWRYK